MQVRLELCCCLLPTCSSWGKSRLGVVDEANAAVCVIGAGG
jgi:hypothetical protein